MLASKAMAPPSDGLVSTLFDFQARAIATHPSTGLYAQIKNLEKFAEGCEDCARKCGGTPRLANAKTANLLVFSNRLI
jgi:hypothetical protein